MPLIAIAGAAIAGAVAAPAIGGLIAGASLTLGSALEITAAVGATLGAVGAVTRDKGLQTAGLVIGGIGGVGSLASAAGLIDGTTTLFGDATAQTATDLAGQTAGTAASADQIASEIPGGAAAGITPDVAQAMGVGAAGQASTNVVDAMNPEAALNAAPPADAAAAASEGQASALLPQLTPNVTAQTQGSGLINQAANAAPGTGLINQAATPPSPATVPQAAQAADQGVLPGVGVTPNQVTGEFSPTGMGGAIGSALSGIKDFATSSPYATYGLIQAGGSLVGGLFNPVTPSQVALYNAQAANNRAAAALTAQQTANIQSGVPGVTRIPQQVQQNVTGSPTAPPGIINQNPTAYATQGAPV